MNKGFTLIEVLVSSALFFIIVSAGLVAFSTFLKFYELAHKKRISLYSISFAVEEIIREARIGHNLRKRIAGAGGFLLNLHKNKPVFILEKILNRITKTIVWIHNYKEEDSGIIKRVDFY